MEKINKNSRVSIPVMMHPLFKVEYAIQNGVEKNILFKSFGGLGDVICAEPTLRYAIRMFKTANISLATEYPELFRHLKFKKVYNLKKEQPNYDNYLTFETITPPDDTNMVWLFFSHMLTNCIDFPSMCALRLQLPVEDKEICLLPVTPDDDVLDMFDSGWLNGVVIHAGRHWQSKTFPASFWNTVIDRIADAGLKPILIGADTDDNRGTVDVDSSRCTDLRNKLSINDSIWLLQQAKVLLTNDSSPLHMAASGDAWIGYIATCKHPDMITHWRRGEWQYKEVNFGRGGIWDYVDFCPNQGQKVEADIVPEDLLLSWLPDPVQYAKWAISKVKNSH